MGVRVWGVGVLSGYLQGIYRGSAKGSIGVLLWGTASTWRLQARLKVPEMELYVIISLV